MLLIGLAFVLLSSQMAFAGKACYLLSNFSAPNFVNLTLNGTKFVERINFVGPQSVGISINDTNSFTLPLNRSVIVANTSKYTYTAELINVSWLPVQHSAVLTFCSTLRNLPNSTTSSIATTTSSSTSSTLRSTTVKKTTSIATTATTTSIEAAPVKPVSGQKGFWSGIIYWLEHL